MEQLVLDLTNPLTRENALLELSKKRESFPELAPYLWHSFGTISALLQASHCECCPVFLYWSSDWLHGAGGNAAGNLGVGTA